ncbi:hypothetical protein AXF42_Ash010643 [Apostasia shenzhenica]|uniref:WW domain-containing protein n=1 Tax=Apostasia shenzhenica TaxID=1088818 RepID=A0A2I0A6M7_9ASPA|nr:hypothetical protein AXF42_Ash010643 [Apostasia shenzhenica]
MGKRRERRLAAMSAANRRVKLDLFAEPPDEEKSSSVHEEVGGDQEQQSASVPTSPSGKKQENPLLLLGQYSDDELDVETNNEETAVDGRYTVELDGQVEEDVEANDYSVSKKEKFGECGDAEQDLDQMDNPKKLEAMEVKSSENTDVEVGHCKNEITCKTDSSVNQASDHVNGNWKLVLHEESNQYYYWNTETGETSWEVPAAMAVNSQNVDGQCVPVALEEGVTDVLKAHALANSSLEMAICAEVSVVGGSQGNNLISQDAGGYGSMDSKNEIYDANQNDSQYTVENVNVHNGNLCGYPDGTHDSSSNEEKDGHPARTSDGYVSEDTNSSQLVKYGETLLQRLNMLDRSAQKLEEYEGVRKEIEIRISDCRALAAYGTTILPFWWHTEAKLKLLESAIDKCEASVQTQEYVTSDTGHLISQDNSHSEFTEQGEDHIGTSVAASEKYENENTSTERTSPKAPQGREHLIDNVAEVNPCHDSVNFVPTLANSSDDDMDVEMEVDESPSVPTVTGGPLDGSNIANPQDDWIPPPPPESESLPPPPPPESEMDPPEEQPSATFPSYTYPDHYNVGFSIPPYDYYSSAVSEVPNGTYYTCTEGSQLTESERPAYYDPLAGSCLPEAASISVDPVLSATYYDVANTSVSSEPVFNSTEPSSYYVEATAVTYNVVLASDHSSAVKLPVNSSNSLTKAIGESQTSSLQAPPALSTAQASGSSAINDVSLDTQPPTVPKNQTKVARSKKRTVAVAPSLRSNKKVSSLVDKWKAAKEELHEDEEQRPEGALEILEKKRQKEIEEWRARQISSGEAEDNANFVPLGGDWRERVKRRRVVKSSAEDTQTAKEVVENEAKQPNLVELSKDLPSGWQAYWDESTNQAYYGNLKTSETTWTRPTR